MWTAVVLAVLAADPSVQYGLTPGTVGTPIRPNTHRPVRPPPPPPANVCAARVPPDRACAADADCAILVRVVDCCGTRRLIGVSRADLPRAQEDERACGLRRACGCMNGPSPLDDGTRVDREWTARVVCRANVCTTTSAAPEGEGDACTPAECGPSPALPNWTCPDGVHRGGLGPCQRTNGRCGWTRLTCPTP